MAKAKKKTNISNLRQLADELSTAIPPLVPGKVFFSALFGTTPLEQVTVMYSKIPRGEWPKGRMENVCIISIKVAPMGNNDRYTSLEKDAKTFRLVAPLIPASFAYSGLVGIPEYNGDLDSIFISIVTWFKTNSKLL